MISSLALSHFKHAIKVHLVIHGGPTLDVAGYALKLIDFVENPNDVEASSECLHISTSIVVKAVGHYIGLLRKRPMTEKLNIIISTTIAAMATTIGDTSVEQSDLRAITQKNKVITILQECLAESCSYIKTKPITLPPFEHK